MARHIEIEKKYELSGGSLNSVLTQFSYVGENRVVDEYYDTEEGGYYQRGIFIRIRNGSSLDIKFNPDHLDKTDATDHVSCHEYSFEEPIDDSLDTQFRVLNELIGLRKPTVLTFQGILEANGLQVLLTIDKTRKTYQNENYDLVIDEIEGLGVFLEIEYSSSQEEVIHLEEILSEIDNLMEDVSARPLSTGSFEMSLRKMNFDLYKKGKYLLDSDKIALVA